MRISAEELSPSRAVSLFRMAGLPAELMGDDAVFVDTPSHRLAVRGFNCSELRMVMLVRLIRTEDLIEQVQRFCRWLMNEDSRRCLKAYVGESVDGDPVLIVSEEIDLHGGIEADCLPDAARRIDSALAVAAMLSPYKLDDLCR